jgi:hypothetical protein
MSKRPPSNFVKTCQPVSKALGQVGCRRNLDRAVDTITHQRQEPLGLRLQIPRQSV